MLFAIDEGRGRPFAAIKFIKIDAD